GPRPRRTRPRPTPPPPRGGRSRTRKKLRPHPRKERQAWSAPQSRGAFFFPKPSPAVAGRPLRVSKGGGLRRRRRPGDMERKGLPAAAGPLGSRRGKQKKQSTLPLAPRRDRKSTRL